MRSLRDHPIRGLSRYGHDRREHYRTTCNILIIIRELYPISKSETIACQVFLPECRLHSERNEPTLSEHSESAIVKFSQHSHHHCGQPLTHSMLFCRFAVRSSAVHHSTIQRTEELGRQTQRTFQRTRMDTGPTSARKP